MCVEGGGGGVWGLNYFRAHIHRRFRHAHHETRPVFRLGSRGRVDRHTRFLPFIYIYISVADLEKNKGVCGWIGMEYIYIYIYIFIFIFIFYFFIIIILLLFLFSK